MPDNTADYPSRADAEALLEWAVAQNPGPWEAHSKTAGRAAQAIAGACGLDADKAYVLGLLHDIGRYEGVRDLHHVLAGYDLMMEKGFAGCARVCLTHSFSLKDIGAYSGQNDCTPAESAFIQKTISGASYDEYDSLIQLCDAICLPQGVCLLEVRLMDVARRHGFNDYTLQKWEACFGLKGHFDKLCSGNIYDLFYDEIRDVSFR